MIVRIRGSRRQTGADCCRTDSSAGAARDYARVNVKLCVIIEEEQQKPTQQLYNIMREEIVG